MPLDGSRLGPDPIDQTALQCAMHVLVDDQRGEAPVRDIVGQAVQTGEQTVALIFGEQPGVEQHQSVRLGRGDVIGRQHPVEVGGSAQRRQRIGRALGEPAAPQRSFVGAHCWSAARSRRAASLDDNPCT